MSAATLHVPSAPARAMRLFGHIPRWSAQSTLVLLSLVLGLVASGGTLLVDPDSQWHIAVGRDIWTAGAVPTTDVYSHTFAGAPWIAKEWLSQLIFFGAYELGGWRAVVLLTASAVGVTIAGLHEWLRRRMHPLAALALTLGALMLAMPHVLARPHILVLPLTLLWMIGLVTAAEKGETPPLAAAIVMTFWANMHGSFPLGLGMAGLLALEGVLSAPRSRRFRCMLAWALFLTTAVAATALSPYGWRAVLVPLRMEGNGRTLDYVAEWHHLALDPLGVAALATLALSIAVLLPDLRRNFARIAAVALLGFMMIRHVRFISVFGLLTPILVARSLGRLPGLAPRRDQQEQIDGSRRALWGLAGVLAAAIPLVLALTAPLPAADVTPDAAYRAAVAAGVDGPVYNDYDFGGFLIAHGVKTFVDGRTDQLFLGDFLPGLAAALASKSDQPFAALLAGHHVTWALIRRKSKADGHLMDMPGWKRLYSDDVATVFTTKRSKSAD